ncbi:MAG: hypothetical protein ABIJ57_16150 [Pseudomonadota bacterium]
MAAAPSGFGATAAGMGPLATAGLVAGTVLAPLAIYAALGGFKGEDQEAVMRSNVQQMSQYTPEDWASNAIAGDFAPEDPVFRSLHPEASGGRLPAGGVGISNMGPEERWKYYYNDYFKVANRYGLNVPPPTMSADEAWKLKNNIWGQVF